MTPSLACANKCVFCWRHYTNPVGKEWKYVGYIFSLSPLSLLLSIFLYVIFSFFCCCCWEWIFFQEKNKKNMISHFSLSHLWFYIYFFCLFLFFSRWQVDEPKMILDSEWFHLFFFLFSFFFFSFLLSFCPFFLFRFCFTSGHLFICLFLICASFFFCYLLCFLSLYIYIWKIRCNNKPS